MMGGMGLMGLMGLMGGDRMGLMGALGLMGGLRRERMGWCRERQGRPWVVTMSCTWRGVKWRRRGS